MANVQVDQDISADRLTLLNQLSLEFNSSLEIDDVLNRVIDGVIGAMNAERGFIMMREGDGSLVFKTARGIEKQSIENPEFEVSRTVIQRVYETSEALLTNDAQKDFSSSASVQDLHLRSILCTPLTQKDRLVGVVYLDSRVKNNIFIAQDLDFLNAIASNAAIAIENARLYQVAVEKGRMEKELQMAQRVQTGLLPQEVPVVPGWEISAHWAPAREVAGDYYDFIPRREGRKGAVIADVVDKGMPAALYMAFSRSVLRASLDLDVAPRQAIQDANHTIATDSAYGMFVTMAYAELTPDSGQLVYVNGGHNPPLLYRQKEGTIQELTRTGMLLGVDETASYEQEELTLDSGDFIVFYTDGVTEAINRKNEEFGGERLRAIIEENVNADAEGILVAVLAAIEKFCGDTAQFDDITLLVIKKV